MAEVKKLENVKFVVVGTTKDHQGKSMGKDPTLYYSYKIRASDEEFWAKVASDSLQRNSSYTAKVMEIIDFGNGGEPLRKIKEVVGLNAAGAPAQSQPQSTTSSAPPPKAHLPMEQAILAATIVAQDLQQKFEQEKLSQALMTVAYRWLLDNGAAEEVTAKLTGGAK
jgi:hypothetical protein